MRWTNCCGILLYTAMQLLGQKSPAPGPGASPPPGTAGVPNRNPGSPNLNPNNNGNNPINDPFASQTIFLSGKVMFDDGSPMNKDVHVERVCGVNIRIEANVDSRGGFSFQVGGNSVAADVSEDASQSGFGSNTRNPNGQSQDSPLGNAASGNSRRVTPEATLFGCELRAAYPGYRSEVVSLTGRKSMDDPNVGTIILHRLGNVQGTTISVTTAEAPKSAQKNFEKAVQAGRKGSLEEAEKRLLAATREYPKYAVAWFLLGQMQERQNRPEDARKSYLAALEADKHYVSPYDQLALLAARENKWEEAARYSKQAIDLNPVEFPSAYWYNAVANYNLNQDSEAAKSGRALLKLDTLHRFPEVNRMLAEMAIKSKDDTAAVGYLKAYLAQVPAAKDADALKMQLLKIEEAKK